MLPLRIRDADRDRARSELDPAHVELVGRRRSVADEAVERVARGNRGRDHPDEEDRRDERPQAPAHQSATSKNPIQPSSVNSDTWAWNMKCPVFLKSISTIPRWPWHSMTVSVYSNRSVVPVG